MLGDVCPARTKDAMLLKLKLQGHAPIKPNPMLAVMTIQYNLQLKFVYKMALYLNKKPMVLQSTPL